MLSNFDIFTTAGGEYKALVEQFTATADSLGQITISFSKGTADNPEVAGIEILAQARWVRLYPMFLRSIRAAPQP